MLALSTFALCPPEATRADLSPYAADVAGVRAEWTADESLPDASCPMPYIAIQDMGDCDTGACYAYEVYDRRQWTIYVPAGLDEASTRIAVMHETVHYLAQCTGYAPDADRDHSDAALWWVGVLGRAEASQ